MAGLKRGSVWLRVFAVISMLGLSFGKLPLTALAQIDDEWEDLGVISEYEYESPTFGVVLEWDDPFAIDDTTDSVPVGSVTAASSGGRAYDYLWLWTEDPISYHTYRIFEATRAIEEEARLSYQYWSDLDNLVDWDRWTEPEIVWEYMEGTTAVVIVVDAASNNLVSNVFIFAAGADGEAYVEADVNLYLTDVEDVIGDLYDVMEIDGDPFFGDLDIDDLLDAVDDYLDGGSSTPNPTPVPTEVVTEVDWEEAGIVDEFEYESPSYGYIVEWDDPFWVDLDAELGPPALVQETDDDGIDNDYLHLRYTDGGNEFHLTVNGRSLEDLDWTARRAVGNQIDFWTSDEYLLDNPDGELQLLLEDSSRSVGSVVLLGVSNAGELALFINEARLSEDGESIVTFTLFATFEDAFDVEDVILDAQDLLLFEGDNIFDVFDVDDILDALDEAVADLDLSSPTPTPTEAPVINVPTETPVVDGELPAGWDELGFLSLNEYESPRFGTTIEWFEPYSLNVNSENDIAGVVNAGSGNVDYDWMQLSGPDGTLYIYSYPVNGFALGADEIIENRVDYLSSSAWLIDVLGDAELVLADADADNGAVVAVRTFATLIVTYYYELRFSDDGETLILIEYRGIYLDAEEVYDSLELSQDSVEVNGDAVLTYFDIDEVGEELEDVVADLLAG